jgi:DNA/RNA-binding domain of Phe-tRNA-synthetase-like protein
MTFLVSAECQALGLRAGAIIFHGLTVGPSPAELRGEITRAAEAVRAAFPDVAAIRAAAPVVSFREQLRQVGVNPKREQPSVERLLVGAHKRGDLPAINSLVDAYNLVSLRSFCSLGAHDLDAIELPVSLRLLTGGESFTPLGRTAPVPLPAGEYGYVDGWGRVLCRLDVVQADFSKVTERTTRALLIVEGTADHEEGALRRAMAEAAAWVTRSCGGAADVVAWP